MSRKNNTFCFKFCLTKQNKLFYIVITQNVLTTKKRLEVRRSAALLKE